MMIFTPRSAASEASAIVRTGERCADEILISYGMSKMPRISAASCIVGRSVSLPIIRSTTGAAFIFLPHVPCSISLNAFQCLFADVAAVLYSGPGNPRHSLIGGRDGFFYVCPQGRYSQDPAAAGDAGAAFFRRAGMKNVQILNLGRLVQAGNRITLPVIARVPFRGHDDTDGRLVMPLDSGVRKIAVGNGEQHRH